MINFELLKKKASEKGIKEIETYTVKKDGISLSLFNGNVEGNTTELSNVVCVRGVYNNQLATVYTEQNEDESIDSLIESIINNATLMTKDDPFFIYEGDKEYPVVEEDETDYQNHSLSDKVELCSKLTKICKESKYFQNVEVEYAEDVTTTQIVNSNGLNVSNNDKSAVIVCEYIAEKDGDVKSNFDYMFIKKWKDIDLDKFANKLIDETVSQFGAESIPSGNYNVVFDKGVVRSLLGAFGGLFNADAVLKKMSLLGDKMGQKVFGENITIVDDPLHKDAIARYAFDDEGVATKQTTLVENGVLKSFLHNLSTASKMNTVSTGNGFKAGVASPVSVSASNLVFKPGDKSLEELFGLVGEGVYITDVSGLHAGVNQISGDFSLQSSGYMIRDGKKAEAITLIIVSSNLFAWLSSVEAIGNDIEFRGSIGAPSIMVKNISISGK